MYPGAYVRPSLFTVLKNIGWSNILDGTQKTLGVINQAIPIVYQVKPVVSNMRSIFKIANAINSNYKISPQEQKITTKTNSPVFYM